jgi:hypothetical protein
MNISFAEVCINPSMPIKQAGFAQQVSPVYAFHDDLHARILSFRDEQKTVHLISCDALGFPYEFQKNLQTLLSREDEKEVEVIVCCTHTHFSADPEDPRFQAEVETKIINAIHTETFKESSCFGISLQTEPFEGVGKSRISHHDANVLLQLLTIYDDGKPWIRLLIHNCHPTIHNGDTPYFTSEYPGYVIAKLKDAHEGMHFTFLQGAAGDVSTRFTRPSQDYAAVKYLGNHLIEEVEKLSSDKVEIYPLDTISYFSEFLKLEHELKNIDLSSIREDISEREKEEIKVGASVNAYLSAHPEKLASAYLISSIKIGPYHLVFCPSEAFSSYIHAIDSEKCALVCYANGYAPYMTGIHDDFITYECFTDTLTKSTKEKYIALLKKASQK